MLKEIYDFLGDESNEFEQFIDPIAYHEKKGGRWNINGWVSYGVQAKAAKLKTGWTMETSMDSPLVYTPVKP